MGGGVGFLKLTTLQYLTNTEDYCLHSRQLKQIITSMAYDKGHNMNFNVKEMIHRLYIFNCTQKQELGLEIG